jgi:hypothetical protein
MLQSQPVSKLERSYLMVVLFMGLASVYYDVLNKKEQGPSHAIASLIISLIPRQLRPLEDEVVRLGVERFKE